MKYNETIQEGFIGKGKGTLSMIASSDIDAVIEIRKSVMDIRLSSASTVDMDYGLFARLGRIARLAGCIRIEGPLLKKISVWGYLEKSVATGTGIIEPKAGQLVTTNITITPNSSVMLVSGDIMLSVAASAVDISGYARLTKDYAKKSVDGEIKGKINCNAIVSGLEGCVLLVVCGSVEVTAATLAKATAFIFIDQNKFPLSKRRNLCFFSAL